MIRLPAIGDRVSNLKTSSFDKTDRSANGSGAACKRSPAYEATEMRPATTVFTRTMDKESSDHCRQTRFIRLGLYAVVAIIAFYQMANMLSSYAMYSVICRSDEYIRPQLEAPIVSLCAEVAELAVADKLPETLAAKWPELRERFKSRSDFVYEASAELSSLSISTLSTLSPAFEEMVLRTEVRNASEATMEPYTGNVTTYYRGLMKCFALNTNADRLFERRLAFAYGRYSGVYMALELTADIVKTANFRVYVHRDAMVYGMAAHNYIDVDLKKTKSVTIEYSSAINDRLPEPYSTACMSYSAFGFTSAAHWQDYCFLDAFGLNGSLPGFVVQPAAGNATIMSEKFIDGDPSSRATVIEKSRTLCATGFPECHQEVLRLQEVAREMADDESSSTIYVQFPVKADRISVCVPAQTFAELCGSLALVIMWWTLVLLVERSFFARK
ncbi:hypothetical protein HDE_04040 [Halotydeus destructor]|nr:hypothetical protein HDE_04040 [Halotydeus destructor]